MFLRVLDQMRVIGSSCSESKNLRQIYKLHLDLSTNCLDADASYGFSYYDPTIAEHTEQAAVSYFGCVFQPSDEAAQVFQITQRPNLRLQKVPEALDFPDLNERLLRCISDQSYEIRLATLNYYTNQYSLNACDVFAYQILELWFTCIKLLEDEDDPIRSKLATDVQKCCATGMEVPTQVEKVLELSFNHLVSVFGHWNEYSQYLSRWVFNIADYTSPPKGGSDLVRRIFDKEINNHHEEKLLILQFCCYHLQRLPNREFSPAQLLEWRSKFHNQLLSFVKEHVGKQRESWVGGVGNQKDVFLPLYGNLLGLYVLSDCIFRVSIDINDQKTLFSDIVELGEALKPFLRNPLLSNMFRVVVRLHEKSMDDLLVDFSSSCWRYLGRL